MSYANDIIKQAKTSLIGFIKFEIPLVAKAVGSEEENYVEDVDLKWNPAIEIPVDNSYLDVYDDCTERRKVVSICVEGDKVVVGTEEGDEIYADNLSVEELGAICDCLSDTYKDITMHK